MLQTLQQIQQHGASQVNNQTDLSVELKKIASDKGFVISDNQGSGNCMFHALSEQLEFVKGIKISHKELRQSVVQYLRKNPQTVSLSVEITCGSGKWNYIMWFMLGLNWGLPVG